MRSDGAGGNWVLLRGLMRERRHWEAFPAQLQHALPHARIVTPDLPGNGALHRERSATSVAAMVELLREQLRAQQVAPPYSLLALSLGAMVATEWSSRYPHEIACCVLINTSMRPFSPFYKRLRWQNYGALVAQIVRGGVLRQERLILDLTSSHGSDAALAARWAAYQHSHRVSRANALRQLWAAARYRAPSAAPPVPLLVLAGARDRLVDPGCSRSVAAAWGAAFDVHGQAGHDLPLDDGAWVAARVAQWRAGIENEDEKKPRSRDRGC